MTKTLSFLIIGFFLVTDLENQGRNVVFAQAAQPSAEASVELRSRAQAAEQAGQYEQAIAFYRQYLSLKPHDDEARTAFALVLAYNKQFSEATAVYKDVLIRHPRDLDVQLALARVYAWQKQYADAQALYEHVLRESPSYTDAKHGLADTLFWNGEDAAALRLYEEVHAVAPTNELAQRIAQIKNRLAQPVSPVRETARDEHKSGSEEEKRPSRDHVSIGYSHFRYSNTIPDERTWQFAAVKHLWGRTFVGQVESIDRFGKHDNVFSGEVYSSLWHKAWGNFAFSFTPKPQFSSQWTLGGAVYQGLGTVNPLLSRLELSLGYRHMSFSKSEVDLFSPGFTIYLPYNLWLTEQIYMVPKSGSRSLSSRLDWQPAERWQAFISGSFGQSVERPTAAQEVVKVNTLRLAGGLEFPLTQRISAEISYQYEDRAKRYSRDGGAIKLTYSW